MRTSAGVTCPTAALMDSARSAGIVGAGVLISFWANAEKPEITVVATTQQERINIRVMLAFLWMK